MIVLCLIHLHFGLILVFAHSYTLQDQTSQLGWRGWVVLTCIVYGYIYIIASI